MPGLPLHFMNRVVHGVILSRLALVAVILSPDKHRVLLLLYRKVMLYLPDHFTKQFRKPGVFSLFLWQFS